MSPSPRRQKYSSTKECTPVIDDADCKLSRVDDPSMTPGQMTNQIDAFQYEIVEDFEENEEVVNPYNTG